MTNISKRKMSKANLDRLFEQLHSIVAKLNRKSSRTFFNELLGPEEKVMLTKRLAAVIMYMEDNSSYRVSQLLKVSPTTAEYIRRDFDNGRYDGITKILQKQKADYVEIWKILETILQAGMPPRGRGRWKSVFKNLEQ